MGISSEVIVAIVGVLVNVPAFCLVLWHCYRKRGSSSSRQRLENADPQSYPALEPRRLTLDTQYAIQLLPLLSVTIPPQELQQ
ncbi:hypothetical protein ACHAPJ_002775 [Fusarium lateritium]